MVLGMHRSGTSAITLALAELGAPLGTPSTIMPSSTHNTLGYWEQLPLMFVNDALLAHLGASWHRVPPADQDIVDALEPLSHGAAETFREVFPGTSWLWKDPRTCLLAPFWAKTTGDFHACVVVFRHPNDVARSLLRSEGVEEADGLSLWGSYTTRALRHAMGRPSLLVCYEDALSDPDGFSLAASGLLSEVGLAIPPGGRQRVRSALRADLRHQAAAPVGTTAPFALKQTAQAPGGNPSSEQRPPAQPFTEDDESLARMLGHYEELRMRQGFYPSGLPDGLTWEEVL